MPAPKGGWGDVRTIIALDPSKVYRTPDDGKTAGQRQAEKKKLHRRLARYGEDQTLIEKARIMAVADNIVDTLDTIHQRLIRILGRKTVALEESAKSKMMTPGLLDELNKAATAWRTLAATKTADKDPTQLSDAELEAALAKK